MKCDFYEHRKKTCGKIYIKNILSQPVAVDEEGEWVHTDLRRYEVLIQGNLTMEK